MAMWEPWHGCHKHSEGCKFCYIHKGDAKRGVDTGHIVLTGKMEVPIERYQKGAHAGEYKIKSGTQIYLCFSSDFLIEEADVWRGRCWEIMKERQDLNFLFLTKRIERFPKCVPADWGDGYDNVTVGCTVENQAMADFRLSTFDSLPIKHKNIICQPMIEKIDLEKHLNGVELVVVGGESDREARPLQFDWVLSVREQCVRHEIPFEFRQTGTHFIKDGITYTVNPYRQMSQARDAGINYIETT